MSVEDQTTSTAPPVAFSAVFAEDSQESSVPSVRQSGPGNIFAAAMLAISLASIDSLTGHSYSRRHDLSADSSTIRLEVDQSLLQEVTQLFEEGASEIYHDGMYSKFSRGLLALLAQYGKLAVRAIAEYLLSEKAKPSVASEAARWLAEDRDVTTYLERWTILRKLLCNSSPVVRDGAILGFATLDDGRARDVLLKARQSEDVDDLRRLLDQVLNQLEGD